MTNYIKQRLRSKALLPTIIVTFAIIVLLGLPNNFENPVYKQYERCKARVLSVNNNFINRVGVVSYGEQYCEVELLTGSHKGEVYEAMNIMSGSLGIDKQFVEDDIALVLIGKTSQENSVFKVTMVDHYRIPYHIFLAVACVVALVLLAGWIGVRAILSFSFTVLSLWKVLIPLLLQGKSPIIYGLLITLLFTGVIIALVYGFDKRFLAAISGALLGTGITAVLTVIFVNLLKIHGAVMEQSESLLYSGFSLNLTEIFIASIFIASSGALTDVSVDITSAVNEVIEANPKISRINAMKSGLNVSRAALGTMSATLLLAYSGGCIGMLMVFVAQGTPIENIMNLNYVSAEILYTLIGGFGLISVAPFTAICSSFLLVKKNTQQ